MAFLSSKVTIVKTFNQGFKVLAIPVVWGGYISV